MMQPTHQLSDAALIQSYLLGSQQALETLVCRHKDKIYTAIFMLVKDKYTAEDIFQETFLKMIRTIQDNRYTEQGKFLAWAIRVARNLCMDHFRKTRTEVPILTPDGKEIFDLLPFSSENGFGKTERAQVHRSVRELIEQLPQDQLEVVVLRIYGNLSFQEIAEITSVSINTSLGRMRYALANLRKMIRQQQLVLR